MELGDVTLLLVGEGGFPDELACALESRGADLARCASSRVMSTVEAAAPELVILCPSAMPEAPRVRDALLRVAGDVPRLLLLCPKAAAARLGSFRHAWIGQLDPAVGVESVVAIVAGLTGLIASDPEPAGGMRAMLAELKLGGPGHTGRTGHTGHTGHTGRTAASEPGERAPQPGPPQTPMPEVSRSGAPAARDQGSAPALDVLLFDGLAQVQAVPPSVSDIAALRPRLPREPSVKLDDLVLSPWTDPPPVLGQVDALDTSDAHDAEPAGVAVLPSPRPLPETPSIRVCRHSLPPPARARARHWVVPGIAAVFALATGALAAVRDPAPQHLQSVTVTGSLHQITREAPPAHPAVPSALAPRPPAPLRPTEAEADPELPMPPRDDTREIPSTGSAAPTPTPTPSEELTVEPPALAAEHAGESLSGPDPRRVGADAQVDLGHDMRKWGRAEPALQAYQRALEILPEYPRAMAGLVRQHLDLHNGPEAVRWARRLVAKQPNRGNNQLLLGDALMRVGDEDGARAAYRQAVRFGNVVARYRLQR